MRGDRLEGSAFFVVAAPAAAAFLLAACTTAVKVQCPALREYSPAFMESAAAQIEALAIPENSPVALLIVDYANLRAATRACQD